jgi:lipopolysaccharide transport system permease protein
VPGDPGDVAETINDADPQLAHPRRFLAGLLFDIRRSGWLTGQLVRHGLRGRYRGSILGYLWLFAAPLAMAAVWIFLHRSGVVSFGETTAPYPVYVVAGLFLWTGFLRMLNSPFQQLNGARGMLARINFPWEALIVAGWVEVLVDCAVFYVLLAGILAAFGMDFLAPLAASIPATLALLVLGAAAGLLTAPFGLLYDDIPRAIGLFTYGLFFLTPIVYPPPSTMPGALTVTINPVGILLVTSREMITSAPVSYPLAALAAATGAVLLLASAWIVFRVATPHIVSKL